MEFRPLPVEIAVVHPGRNDRVNGNHSEIHFPAGQDSQGVRLSALATRGTRQRIRAGTIFVSEGELSSSIYLILTGQVEVYSAAEDQRELIFGSYGPGELIGEVALDGEPRIASVRAVTNTECVVISRPDTLRFISEYPEFALDLLNNLIHRVRDARKSMQNLVFLNNYARLRDFLLSTVESTGSDFQPVVLALTHRDIATRIGCSREMVTKLLKDLAKRGYLSVGRGEIRLLKALPEQW